MFIGAPIINLRLQENARIIRVEHKPQTTRIIFPDIPNNKEKKRQNKYFV